MLIDTHTHFYDEWLLPDAEEAISRALSAGVSKMIQADVDSTERPAMWAIGQKHPGVIFQMLGLYPGSVDSNWQEELDQVHHIASADRQTSGTLDQVQPTKTDQVQHIASADRQALGTLDQVQRQKADQVHHIASAARQTSGTLDQVQHITSAARQTSGTLDQVHNQKADQVQHITSAARQTSGTLDQVHHQKADQVQHIASADRQTSGTLDQVQPTKTDQVQHIASADRQALGTLDQVQRQKADQVHHIASAARQTSGTLDQVQHITSAARQTSGTLDQVHNQKADQVQHITSAARQTSGTLDQVHHQKADQVQHIASADRQTSGTLDQVQPATHPYPPKTDFINMPERFVAIGEIGLDYHEGKEFAKEQKEVLRLQFELAAKMNLPVNIHLRDAWEDFFAVLEDCRHLHLRGNLHCFTASYEIYERANKWADFSVGIGGVVTFKNSNLAKTLERIPMEKILLETDAPYLAPVPWRGRRNESAYLPIIAEKVAQIKGLSIDETADITTRNAEILFGI